MRQMKLAHMSVDELLRAYEEVVLQQGESFKNERVAAFNKQFQQREEISHELRSRPGDRREELAALFKHPTAWVRICVARDTFVLNEARARMHMQYIAEHRLGPLSWGGAFLAGELGQRTSSDVTKPRI
jgi:hypothetical protein